MNEVVPGEDEVVLDLRLTINCPGISSSGLASTEQSMKDALKDYLEDTFRDGVEWETHDGLAFYISEAQLEWQTPEVPSLDGS